MVFMALTNCFRKTYMNFLHFVFISYIFCSSKNCWPESKIQPFQNVWNNVDNFFICCLISVMTLNRTFFRISRWIFELCHYFFLLFLSTFGAVSVKTGRHGLPMVFILMSVTSLYSSNGFFILVLRVFIFFKFLSSCIFYEFILSRFELSHYWQVQIKEGNVGKIQNVGKSPIWICWLFLLNSLCFLGWDSYLAKLCGFLFILPKFVFLLVVLRHIPNMRYK